MSASCSPSGTGVQKHAAPGDRWWIYQKERFPLLAYVPVIAAFSFAAVAYSESSRDTNGLPEIRPIFTAFVASLLFFLQLRLADDLKDAEDDSHYRPYRPLPRGLVTVRELVVAWLGCLLLQTVLALWLSWRLLPLLAITSAYMLVMSNKHVLRVLGLENWVERHPALYRATGPVIVPLIFIYAGACDWFAAGYIAPSSFASIVAANYLTAMVIEIGRKVRAPEDEELGVETYSAVFGRRKAVVIWLATMLAAAACACIAAREGPYTRFVAILLGLMLLVSVAAGVIFLRHTKPGRGSWIEATSRSWALTMYLSLGALPALLRVCGV
jgi:4-hydroxybenzoate polyprenyltransferase